MNLSKDIFAEYAQQPSALVDRYAIDPPERAVDVILPLINTNSMLRRNLYNFYERIPINRLLVGDGGITDDSLEILKDFPRVTVLNHRALVSQGGSIAELIKAVSTNTFVYLHADVFLPLGWLEEMEANLSQYDWFECPQRLTVMIEYWNEASRKRERAYSGAQMGRTDALQGIVERIEDDYLQRNEDIVLSELVQSIGLKYGKVDNTFHYHQVMNRRGEGEPKFESVLIRKQTDIEWEKKIFEMQYKGIVKYLKPNKKYLVDEVNSAIQRLLELGACSPKNIMEWVRKANPEWTSFIRWKSIFKDKLKKFLRIAAKRAGM